MIVADASWIIAQRDPHNIHHAAAVRIAQHTMDETIILHPLTLAECLVSPARSGQLEPAAAALRAAYQIADIDPGAPLRWARLRAETRLRLPDAIVLDTAVVNGATILITFDLQLARAAAGRRITVRGARMVRRG